MIGGASLSNAQREDNALRKKGGIQGYPGRDIWKYPGISYGNTDHIPWISQVVYSEVYCISCNQITGYLYIYFKYSEQYT